MHVSAVESGAKIVFLHDIQPGPASRSYGVQVARLAGMPALAGAAGPAPRSRHWRPSSRPRRAQIDLFAVPAATPAPEPSPVDAALAGIDPDTLTPRDALAALYQLKSLQNAAPEPTRPTP